MDNGKTWDVTQSLPYQGVEAIHASGNGRLWLGTGLGAGGYTVFFSDDQGDSWQPATFFTRFETCEDAFSIQSAGETIFVLCGVVNPGPNLPFRLFRGNTGGTVFTDVSPNPGLGQSMFVLNAETLWSGSDGGLVYFSDTAGDHWSEIAIPASLDGFQHYNQIWSGAGPTDFFIFNNDRRLSSLVAHYH